MKTFSHEQLDTVRIACRELVPKYAIQEADPLKALETGVGNCFAKAMVACGIIAIRHEFEASVAYSERLHGTDKPSTKPFDPRTKKNMAHITVLVPEARDEEQDEKTLWHILGLDYGIDARTDPGDILDYNEAEDLAVALQPHGEIVATRTGSELGLSIGNWREKSIPYLEAINRPTFDPDLLVDKIRQRDAA